MKQRIKQSYISKDIDQYEVDTHLVATHIPAVGDVAVFEILQTGKHKTM